MYAVFKSGGAQHRAELGTVLFLQKLPAEVGSMVTFDEVLMVVDGDTVTVGQPTILGSQVHAEVIGQDRAKKIEILKFRRRKHSMKRQGHRQYRTKVEIKLIQQARA